MILNLTLSTIYVSNIPNLIFEVNNLNSFMYNILREFYEYSGA